MGSHDTVANWVIGLSAGDTGDLTTSLSALKGQFQSAVNDLQRITANIDVFSGLQDKVEASSKALAAAQQNVVTFTAALAAAQGQGKDVTLPLQQSLAAAQKAVITTTAAFNSQVAALSTLENSLSVAGVNTGDLAASQAKYAAATVAATDALKLQQAQQTLGLVTTASIAPELDKLNAALATTKAGFAAGSVSAAEMAQAELLFQQQVKSLNAEVSNLPGLLGQTQEKGVSAFHALGGEALLAIVGVGSFAEAMKTAVEASIDFSTNLVKIGTITTLSSAQLDSLGESARSLARTVGVDVNDALKSLYDIIRATNLGPTDALEVLSVSAETAKASFTDLNATSKVSQQLISGFRLPVSDLAGAMDLLFTSAQHGGPALGKLGDNFGKLLIVAHDSNIPLNVVVAALNSMTSATGDGSGAVNDLQKLLLKFDTTKVQQALKGAGISATDFQGVMDELAAKGLHIEDFVNLGLVSAKTGIALDALTQGNKPLAAALAQVANNANSVSDALAKVEATPKENIEKLIASIKDLAISAGNTLPISAIVVALTAVGTAAADSNAKLRALQAQAQGQVPDWAQLALRVISSTGAYQVLNDVLLAYQKAQGDATSEVTKFRQAEDAASGGAFASAMKANSDAAQKLSADIKKATQDLSDSQQALVDDAGKLQAASELQLAASDKSTSEQIAGLGRLKDASAATSDAVLQIQSDGTAQRIAIIQKTEADVQALLDEAIGVREKALADEVASGKTTYAQGQADLAQIRLTAVNATLKDYQGLYDSLAKQQQGYQKDAEAAANAKLEFDKGIEKTAFDLQIQALGSFQANITTANAAQSENLDQYVAQVNEANRLIAAAQAAANAGNSKAAEENAKQAIGIANQLKTVVSANGATIISSFDLVQTKAGLVKTAADIVDKSFEDQGSAAQKGAEETKLWLGITQGRILDLQNTVDNLRDTVAKGLKYSISVDEKSYEDAVDKLAALKDKTVTVTVQVDGVQGFTITPIGTGFQSPDGTFDTGPDTPIGQPISQTGFARGGWVSKFARGGGVGDIVPAMLDPREFVLQPSAVDGISRMFGGGFLDKLNRFASGGTVFDGTNADSSTVKDGFGEVKQALQYILDRTGIGAWDIVDTPQSVQYAPPGDDGTSDEAFLDNTVQMMSALQGLLRYKGIDADSAPLAATDSTQFDGTNVTVGVVNDGLKEVEVALQHLLDEAGFDFKVNSGISGSGSTILDTLQEVMGGLQFYIKSLGWNDSSIPGFAGGGYAQKAIQGFATGGFAAPRWSKVPGFGDSDTVPALLRTGSFVMKKAASGMYGDGVMGRLAKFAEGGPVGFATGGYTNLPWGMGPNGLTQNPNLWITNKADPAIAAAEKAIHDLKVLASQDFTDIMSKMGGLPAVSATNAQTVGQYLRQVMEVINLSNDPVAIQAAIDLVMSPSGYDAFKNGIALATQFHVPLVMGANVGTAPQDPNAAQSGGGVNGTNIPGVFAGKPGSQVQKPPAANVNDLAAWLALQNATSNWDKLNPYTGGQFSDYTGGKGSNNLGGGNTGNPFWDITLDPGNMGGDSSGGGSVSWGGNMGGFAGYASGGTVDSIRALLTPGEFVLTPPAVQNITRLYGGGFLDAVNGMQIAPDFLERAMTPPQPRRYATGGYVDGPGAPMLSTSVKGGSRQEVHVHFHADKMDAAEVRRTVIPEINKILRAAK